MPRYSELKAHRPSGGDGPITEHVRIREEHMNGRYDGMGRPCHVLDALRQGEPVEMPVSLIPRKFWRNGWQPGHRVTITPEM